MGGARAVSLGALCFVSNLMLVGLVFELIFPGVIHSALDGFYSHDLHSKSVPIRMLISLAAALSEEAVFRFALLRFMSSVFVALRSGGAPAVAASSLVSASGIFMQARRNAL